MTAPDLWLCVNVGVDGVDIMAKEMSVVWLMVDFFSSYHRSDVREQHMFSGWFVFNKSRLLSKSHLRQECVILCGSTLVPSNNGIMWGFCIMYTPPFRTLV